MSQNTAQGLSGEATATSRPMPNLNNSPLPRPKRRRRPWVFALCAALVAAGALGTAFAFTSINDTQEVLVVANDIKRGETIEAGDLSVVRVSVDPALTPVAGSQKSDLVGSRAAADLWAGTLLTESAVTDSPGAGGGGVAGRYQPHAGTDAVRVAVLRRRRPHRHHPGRPGRGHRQGTGHDRGDRRWC